MISACVVPTVKHGGGGVVYLEFKTHLPAWLPQHSTAIRHPIWFALSGTIFCFSTGQWPYTPPGGVRAIWPRRRVMECCIRWPGLHNHQTSTQLRWFGMSWTPERRKSSQQVLSICGNNCKTVGKAFQVKLVERMPRVCKAVIKAKGGYFEETRIYFDLFNTFGYYMIPCVLFHRVDVFTIILQCRKYFKK